MNSHAIALRCPRASHKLPNLVAARVGGLSPVPCVPGTWSCLLSSGVPTFGRQSRDRRRASKRPFHDAPGRCLRTIPLFADSPDAEAYRGVLSLSDGSCGTSRILAGLCPGSRLCCVCCPVVPRGVARERFLRPLRRAACVQVFASADGRALVAFARCACLSAEGGERGQRSRNTSSRRKDCVAL
ncbi:hypothetical protein ERJ75_000526200 [Trypanosoma vivax]|nr:hypothetical protein ERJ75_000526200 [Trypanosoma vivax]